MSDTRATTVNLTGRITSAARLTLSFDPIIAPLYGRITSAAKARIRPALLLLNLAGGRISSAGFISLAPWLVLQGTYVGLSGVITSASKITLAVPHLNPQPLYLSGRISAAGTIGLQQGQYYAGLSGHISSAAQIQGTAGPWFNLLRGDITAQLDVLLDIAEVSAPPPPYPPPFPTNITLDYLDLITSEHNQKPKYYSTVELNVDPVVDDQQLVAGIFALFDLDYCVGEQEDFTGEWVGKSRWIEIPNVFFSWDTLGGVGWNQGNWKGPSDAANSLQRLDDYHYRLLLYATVIANHWDGSTTQAYEAWDTLFQYTGIKILIQDYGNMTMLYGILATEALDAVLIQLFITGQMDLRPEGVELRAYALQPTPGVPFFSWDSSSDSVQGWDSGYWGVMVAPGSSTPVL
jgi:hypothetical protein